MRGIILRAESDSLVVQASAEEVRRFTPNQRVRVDGHMSMDFDAAIQLVQGTPRRAWMDLYPGSLLYDAHARPVAIIEEIRTSAERYDVTGLGDTTRRYEAGPLRCHIRALGYHQ